MKELLNVTGALADSNRVRALAACYHGELCVCQVIELLGLAPSTVSKHLSILRHAGLLAGRKEGRWMYYRVPDEPSAIIKGALALVRLALDNDKQIAQDLKHLKRIVKIDPEELCQRQRTDTACCSCVPATRAVAKWPKVGRGT